MAETKRTNEEGETPRCCFKTQKEDDDEGDSPRRRLKTT